MREKVLIIKKMENYFATLLEDVRIERPLTLLLSLADEVLWK